MAEKKYESYKELSVYRNADKQMRREVDEFIKKYHPSNDEMYLQLKRYELKNLDKKDKRNPNTVFGLIMMVVVVIFYVMMRQSMDNEGNPIMMIIVGVILLIMYVLYYNGVFSKTKSEIAQINKQLSKTNMPEFAFSEKEKQQ